MKATSFLALLIPLLPALSHAQEGSPIQSSGRTTIGVQGTDVDTGSSKFTEYRDLSEGFHLYELRLDLLDTRSGLFLELTGDRLVRDDQSLRFRVGDHGSWKLVLDRNDIPHNLSNKAMTPFVYRGGGLLTLPSTVETPHLSLAPSASQLNENDPATADWLDTHLRDTDLGFQRGKTSAMFQLTPGEDLRFRLTASDHRKDGSKISYGPIGDRPPRTLNVQLTEPLDYRTRELRLETQLNRPRYQAQLTYMLSDFSNENPSLQWQNLYTGFSGSGLGFDQWTAHRVGTFGRRAQAPDNVYHNAALSFGLDLPRASRLSATAAFGWMKQDEVLLPYSVSNFDSTAVNFASTDALPRQRADAEMSTTLLNLDYTINPIRRTNLRAFFRYYDLDNKTPQDNWWYVTSDTIGGSASATVSRPTYKNQRTNLAYAYDQMSFGLDATFNLASRTTLGLRLEREQIDRDFRQASTAENIVRGTLRSRPASWLSIRAAYLFGDRDADGYDVFAANQSYWYDPVGRDNDNPLAAFTDHPDMRKYDVSDRRRNQLDLSASLVPRGPLSLTASLRYRNDDFDSGVAPTQPLLGSPFAATEADQLATTPGDQLGLLDREVQRYAVDAVYAPDERLSLNAFASREVMSSNMRQLEYNENNRVNPISSGLDQTNELGPWTRASSQWTAKTDDALNTFGVGGGYFLIPQKLRLLGETTVSLGSVDIDYRGFGTQSALNPSVTLPDNHQFAFRSPPTSKHNQYNLNASLEYRRESNMVLGLHYLFESYRVEDWMLESDTPWFESVGSEFLLRDTSAATSTQWGNRLVSLGSYLAPSYDAHVIYATASYRF
jgi:MtrB/PioB family decaheme-associated outer membrane protein